MSHVAFYNTRNIKHNIALRTPIGIPPSVRILNAERDGLPELPSLGLVLHRAGTNANPLIEHLALIIRQALQETLPREWLRGGDDGS